MGVGLLKDLSFSFIAFFGLARRVFAARAFVSECLGTKMAPGLFKKSVSEKKKTIFRGTVSVQVRFPHHDVAFLGASLSALASAQLKAMQTLSQWLIIYDLG